MNESTVVNPALLEIAGFWPRLGAFVLDALMLGTVSMILGWLLFDPLARIGLAARLIGFVIALVYFGLGNSRLNGGQSPAKRLVGLRVVDRDGAMLSPGRALVRCSVLVLPAFLNGLPVDLSTVMSSVLGGLLSLAIFGGALSIVYLYVFNTRTRQSLHDLVVGSVVVRIAPRGIVAPVPALWTGHLVVIALIAAIALGLPVLAERLSKNELFADLLPMQASVAAQPHVIAVQVMRGWSSSSVSAESHFVQTLVRLDAPLTDDAAFAKSVAVMTAAADSKIANEDRVVVNLVYGYDMVVASGWKRHGYSFKPDELR